MYMKIIEFQNSCQSLVLPLHAHHCIHILFIIYKFYLYRYSELKCHAGIILTLKFFKNVRPRFYFLKGQILYGIRISF